MTPILVLHDLVREGASVDALDTMVQVEAVREALRRRGRRVACAPVADPRRLRRDLARRPPGLVFNLVESLPGEGATVDRLPSVLESLGLPFTGSGSRAMRATSDKLAAKDRMRRAGLPTPDWRRAGDLAETGPALAGRWIVKSVWEHASFDMNAASVLGEPTPAALRAALRERAGRSGGERFAERFVEGRELNLALLANGEGVEVLPAAEILFVDFPADKPRIVDHAAKWSDASFEATHTPRRLDFGPEDAPLIERLSALAVECWRLFGLAGYARVDFRVDAQGRPWILEINANPCLSPDAGFVAAAAERGLPFDDVVERIVAAAFLGTFAPGPCSG